MTANSELTADLRKLVLEVEDDLRTRLDEDSERRVSWQEEHRQALKAERTSAAWTAWRDDRITQSAVAWVLATVFVRFCEDNSLLSKVWISGPGTRRQEALDAEIAYFRTHPEHTWREWTLQAVEHLKNQPATAGLVEEHSPLWQIQPSGHMAKKVLDFWRATDDAGTPLRDLTDPELSTRFLGDLYQDLSEHAKKTYALLQTPDFVEEFILNQTLTPALAERPLEDFKLIDPTCGSGHFLLGAFQRFLDAWSAHAPGLDARARVQQALDSVYGVDLNPFAVAIARFRLTVAALQACGEKSLEQAPAFDFHLAAGDSLLHGQNQREFRFEGFDADAQAGGFAYATEDLNQLKDILRPGQYDVVVGNPPYITVKDKTLNQRYRKLYPTCKGTYALTVPFMERFFGLAKHGNNDQPAGWTGQITSNSFMKREFGSKIIEEFLTRQDLRLVADTSGAYIPGHGTPTVIIVGRHQRPVGSTVRAVLGVRGEPGRPENPEKGLVWQTVINHVDQPGFEDEWVSITDLPREMLGTHPWSLTGGGAASLVQTIERVPGRVSQWVKLIGRTCHTGSDDAYFAPTNTWQRLRVTSNSVKPMVTGDVVRDWVLSPHTETLFPYDSSFKASLTAEPVARLLWAHRTHLAERREPGGTHEEIGLTWYEWSRWHPERFSVPLGIAMAFVATHNHFVLDRGGKVFKQSAPVIKLPEGANEDDHLALLGVLNSSTACFWLKQNSYPKGGDPVGDDGARVSQLPWSDRYEFTGTTLQDFPLPTSLPLERGRQLDASAQENSSYVPSAVASEGVPTADLLADAQKRYESTRRRMIAQQEELDWEVYRLYGLTDDDVIYNGDDLPEINLGERAFEIALARRVVAGETDTAWFDRHGSTPIPQIPAHWPTAYRELVQRRLDLIENNPSLRLLEKPEHKRRWSTEAWEKQQERALRSWLLDRLEDRNYWFDAQSRPTPRSIAQLADAVSRDSDLVSVLALWDGTKDVDVVKALTRLLTDEAVPYLAAQRLKDSGLRKREAWEHTWDLQRREDAGEDVGTIPVPPKYTSADFRKASWWQARGKLDVSKERFILYPDAGRSTDPTLLLGWAGWNHAEQFLALAMIMDQRVDEGIDDDKMFVPLVAGMAEVLPWVRQWHQELDPTFGVSMADFCSTQLEDRMTQLGTTLDDLKTWRPTAAARGRRIKKENA